MKQKKQLAAKILKISPGKVRFNPAALEDIKKAITRSDMRGLIAVGKITDNKSPQQSRGRARKIAAQKRKGRRRGQGTKKGSKFAHITRKEQWTTRIRVQRSFLRELREKDLLTAKNYQNLYQKSKGGYFRNRRHIKLYITEHNLFEKK